MSHIFETVLRETSWSALNFESFFSFLFIPLFWSLLCLLLVLDPLTHLTFTAESKGTKKALKGE